MTDNGLEWIALAIGLCGWWLSSAIGIFSDNLSDYVAFLRERARETDDED